jgi:CubicO group peptidase (beta-lactamase class C family)
MMNTRQRTPPTRISVLETLPWSSMMMQPRWLGPWLASVLLAIAAGQGSTAETDADLSRQVDQLMQKRIRPKGPGAAVLVVRGGKVVHSRGYGLANLKDKTPVTPQTVFDLASVSKQFTALAVLILHERGQLSLNDEVRKYLPQLPPRRQSREPRVRDLLQHTSGLPEYFELVDTATATNEDVLRAVAPRKPAYPAGTKHRYCNTGYAMAALVVERASGQKFPAFMRREVFGPLHMDHTTVCAGPPRTPDRAIGYAREDGKLKPQQGESPIYGDGSVFTSLEDMARWDAGLRAARLVRPQTLRLAWTPGRLDNGKRFNYGLGWEMERNAGKLVVWHSGGWAGFATYICRHVDDGLTVVVLTNSEGRDPGKIGDAIAELHLGGGD